MKQLSPRDIIIQYAIPPKVGKDAKVAIDLELFGMENGHLHRPTGRFASAAFCINGKDAYIITNPELLIPAFENIQDATQIFHNAHFDAFHLRRWMPYPKRNKIWDTMIVDQEMWAGYYYDFSLKALARRYLDVYMEKEVREEFTEATEMTKEMLEYAAIDVVATHQIYQKQREQMTEADLNVWKNIDRPALWTVLAMSGSKLDTEAWCELARSKQARVDAIKAKYPDVLLSSWQQVLKRLKELGYTDLKSTKEDNLKGLVDECEFVRDLLEFRGLAKAMSTYGENWVQNHVEADGRVYSNFHVCGAATGRFSSSEPNVENIPRRDGPEFRRCFIAGDGNVLIDADWSSQEPRIAAYLSQDGRMIDIFRSGKDIYIEACRLMYDGREITKKDPFRNSRMKPTVLGASYGLTPQGMSLKYQVPLEEAEDLMARFWEAFPDLKKWADEQKKIRDYVTTIYGRKYWLNSYQGNHSENNSLNSPIQGSAGDALKIAAHRFLEKWGWSDENSVLVNLVHDEMLVEVPEELQGAASQLLRETMIEVAEEMTDGVPADVEIGIGKDWASAHA